MKGTQHFRAKLFQARELIEPMQQVAPHDSRMTCEGSAIIWRQAQESMVVRETHATYWRQAHASKKDVQQIGASEVSRKSACWLARWTSKSKHAVLRCLCHHCLQKPEVAEFVLRLFMWTCQVVCRGRAHFAIAIPGMSMCNAMHILQPS